MSDLHLLRPEWLLALLPLLLVLFMLRSKRGQNGNLDRICDPRLLPYLLIDSPERARSNHILLIGIGGLLAILALAGPSWKKLEQPLFREQSSLVILLDLSKSMDGNDIEPSRLTKARFKLHDLLKRRNEGQTALIVFAAQPFVVTPLTDDNATIDAMVGSLTTDIMPSQGSRHDLAMQRGVELLQQSAALSGDLLYITDGIDEQLLTDLLQSRPLPYRISVLGIGTAEGGPIPLAQGGFVQDQKGDIVIDKLDEQRLIRLAFEGGGVYSRLTYDDRDIDAILARVTADNSLERAAETQFSSDLWQEEGPWLLLPLLLLASLAFRRGYLVLLLLLAPLPGPVHALEWGNLWLTPDQQAARSFAAGNPQQAASQFEDKRWRAAAHYQAGEFQQSLEALEGSESADSHYNRGNALARLGRLQESIEAYEKSLVLKPDDKDAQYNLELVKKQLEQQKQQQQPQQDNRLSGDDQQGQNKQDQAQSQEQEEQQKGDQQSAQTQADDAQSEGAEQSTQQRQNDQHSNDQKQQEQTKSSPTDQADEQPAKEKPNQESSPNPTMGSDAASKEEEQQAAATQQADQADNEQQDESTRQWLRRIPDDPGGLLKRKFQYQYQQQFQGRGESQPW